VASRQLRVLAIATHPVQYAAPLFRRMAARSDLHFEVAYCSLRGAKPAFDPDFNTSVQWDVPLLDGYTWQEVPNRGSGADSFFGLRNPGLWRLIRNGRFDAVLCYVGYVRLSFWIAYFAARRSGTAFLFGTDATKLAPHDGRSWKIAIKKLLWPTLFALADQVIVPSSGTRQLVESLGIPTGRITLTPYTVDNSWWMQQAAKVDRQAIRAGWGAGSQDVVILFCAKLQLLKRPMDLLAAFAKCKGANLRLVFSGDGVLRAGLQAEAERLGVAGRVLFLGFLNQSQLPAVYTSADVMVLPSEHEAFGVVVNEAMCCGCPVIVSDRVGAARDLIVPVEPDFVYPFGDIDALAAKLGNAAEHPELLRTVGARALAHIQTWSPERNVEMTVAAVELAVLRKHPAQIRSTDREATPEPVRQERQKLSK
jgi:glycosyltransferase involved in cell wall biosynthesis